MYNVNGTRSKIKIYWYFSVDTKISCLVTGSLNYIKGKDCYWLSDDIVGLVGNLAM